MSLATSVADHLLNFGTPGDVGESFVVPEANLIEAELEVARRQIADLQKQLIAAGETARAEAQAEIDALVKVKDEELQAGLDELRATYEERVGQLAEALQTQVTQHNKDMSDRLVSWCRPVLRSLSTDHCIEDLAAVIEALLNDKCELTIKGPEHLLEGLKPHLADLPGPAWTMAQTDGPEIVITSGETRIETCLDEWLNTVGSEVG